LRTQIVNLHHLFKLPLKAIVATTKTNRFDKHAIETISLQTHSDQSCLSKVSISALLRLYPCYITSNAKKMNVNIQTLKAQYTAKK